VVEFAAYLQFQLLPALLCISHICELTLVCFFEGKYFWSNAVTCEFNFRYASHSRSAEGVSPFIIAACIYILFSCCVIREDYCIYKTSSITKRQPMPKTHPNALHHLNASTSTPKSNISFSLSDSCLISIKASNRPPHHTSLCPRLHF
jgi:hypothetical protein